MNLSVGSALPELVIESVSGAAMKTVACLLDDPNPIHFDSRAVARRGLGDRVVNQGTSNVAYILNMLTAWSGSRRSIRGVEVRFLGNVYEGDRVLAGGQVRWVEEVRDTVRVELDVWLDRDRERLVVGRANLVIPA